MRGWAGTRHRLNRSGDRQLTHALHIIAVSRARHDPDTKAYLARKPRARPRGERCAASSATSPAASTGSSRRPPHPDRSQTIRPAPTPPPSAPPNAHALPDLAAGGPQRPCAARSRSPHAHGRSLVSPDRGHDGSPTPAAVKATRSKLACGSALGGTTSPAVSASVPPLSTRRLETSWLWLVFSLALGRVRDSANAPASGCCGRRTSLSCGFARASVPLFGHGSRSAPHELQRLGDHALVRVGT